MNGLRSISIWLIGTFLIMMMASVISCGKKGDPIAYDTKPAPPILDLKLEKTSESIAVQWPIAAGQRGVSIFRIEKSALNPKDDECPGCPRTFDIIADVGIDDPTCRENNQQKCRYTDYNVITGYHYVYRILSCDDAGRCERTTSPAEIIF